MKPMAKYKSLQERLEEEKEYFYRLLGNINKNLKFPQIKELQAYLKTNSALVDARHFINEIEDDELKKQIRESKKTCEKHIHSLLENFLSEEEIFNVIYIFDKWIIDGKIVY